MVAQDFESFGQVMTNTLIGEISLASPKRQIARR